MLHMHSYEIVPRGPFSLAAAQSRDTLNRDAIAELYGLESLDDEAWRQITDRWRPYRMWATVLLRVGWERSSPGRSYRHAAK
jgi:3-methyladenine DNA glycosylase/8-oxoguanine DNA glycosylase